MIIMLRWDRNDYHAGDDVYGSNYMKDKLKVRADMMKPGVDVHVFCAAVKFALSYKASASETMEVRSSAREVFGRSAAESENETIKPRPVF